MLKLYNLLTRKKEKFTSIKPKEVSLYVCGITPYDTTHLGHAFTYIAFDVLVKYLTYLKYKVNYTQNVTDINDRDNDLLKRAKEQKILWQDLSSFWTGRFLEDMSKLNWTKPTNFIKASENIDFMVELISKLIKNGHAYRIKGSVYYDISKKNDFGKLARLSRNQMLKLSREFEEDVSNPDKKDPLDITLWRGKTTNQEDHIPTFESPFGKGRPGWHIECSAMAISTLGEKIDIHGGGIDLIYPHHEAEIAQSEGATKKTPFAKYWMHVAPVSYKGSKMSKSSGNLIMVSNLLKNYSANAIRWYLISHHYKTAWEYNESDLRESEKNYKRVVNCIVNNNNRNNKLINKDLLKRFCNGLDDDLDTPSSLSIIEEMCLKKEAKTLELGLSILGFTS